MQEEGWSLKSQALHLAVGLESLTMVRSLLWSGANVNYREGSSKRTALHLVCEKDDPRNGQVIVALLLKSGADVNAKNARGRTALHEACARSNLCVVETLMWHGARTSVVDENGTSPLHEVLTHCGDDSLRYSLDVLLRNTETLREWPPAADEDLKLVVNTQNAKGCAVLHLASMRNREDIVQLLLQMGANVGVNNVEGMTALHSAAMACAGDVLHVLIDAGEEVNAKDVNGNTPLHLACSSNYHKDPYYNKSTANRVKTIENLLSRGALIYERNESMKTPYDELKECYSSSNPTLQVKIEIEEMFIKHVLMLKTLNLQEGFNFRWLLGKDYYDKVKEECCRELDEMKSTIIEDGISLSEVLSHTVQPGPLSADDLKNVADSVFRPDLLTTFPLYGPLLRNFFQRSMVWPLKEADGDGVYGFGDRSTVAD